MNDFLNIDDFVTTSDTTAFEVLLKRFAKTYPTASPELVYENGANYVRAYNRIQFCVDGYNLLYNTWRLCKVLEGELS